MNNDSFIMTLKIDKNNRLFRYGQRSNICNCTVDFGDGTIKNFKDKNIEYVYKNPGIYNVAINGSICSIRMNDNNHSLIDINQWGNVDGMDDWSWVFSNCHNLTNISAIDTPNLTKTVGMFYKCKNLNADLSKWDVSNIEDMFSMFHGCSSFNSDLSNWNVSKVEIMNYTFFECENFNSDLSKWNVSKLKQMIKTFYNCKKFDSDLSNWNVLNIKKSLDPFKNCKNENENLIQIIDLYNL